MEWTPDDRDWLHSMFNGVSGRKFRRLLRQEIDNTAIWAVNRTDSIRACGYAAGAAYMVGLIEACLPHQDIPTETEVEEVDLTPF